MDVRALIRGHEHFAEETGAEVRHDDGHAREAGRGRGKRKRISQTQVKGRRQPELLPDTHAQYAAVREHHRALGLRGGKYIPHALIVQPVSVHRRKETDATHAVVAEHPRQPPPHVSLHGVEHEKADEPRRVPADGRDDGVFVTRYARDECDPRDIVPVHLGHPAVRQFLHRAGIIPPEAVRYCGSAVGVRQIANSLGQQLEEPGREQVAMNVAKAHGDEAIIIGLVSDTHGLVRPGVFDALAGVSRILHAGDVGGRSVLDELQVIAPVIAVYGNVDPPGPPLEASHLVQAGGLTIHLSHGHELGSPTPEKLLDLYAGDIIVYGHTHQALVHRVGSRLVINPGAAGPRRFNGVPSVARLTIARGRAEVEILEIR